MLSIAGGMKILLYREAVDMRKSIDGLSYIIVEEFSDNPSNGGVYVFFNKSRDKLKLLYWDRNGFCLWYKRLEEERFKLPAINGSVMELSAEHLRWLMDGLDIGKLEGFKRLNYEHYY